MVLISSLLKSEQGLKEERNTDFYMISSISYVNLEPLVISTTFLKTSKTGFAALLSKQMAVSLLSFEQLDAVEQLGKLSSAEKAQNYAAENLAQCGFTTGRLKSGLLFIEGSIAFSLRIFDQTELEQYIVVMAELEENQDSNFASISAKEAEQSQRFEPLIRYNRLYGTIDKKRLSQGNDRYPV